MPNSTLTLQSIINLAATHVDLLPLSGVGGYTNEPALSLCNDLLSDILTSPNDWKFNSADMPMLVTAPNKQDYLFAGATAFALGSSPSGSAVDLASNNAITQVGAVTTVNTIEAHRFKVGDTVFMVGNTIPDYNSLFTDDGNSSLWSGGWTITSVTLTSFTFTHANSGLAVSGAPGIDDLGWLASASMVQMSNTNSPQSSVIIQAVRDLQPWSVVGHPDKVCIYRDNGDGTLLIRFKNVPGTAWGIKLVYQKKAPLKTALAETWSPIPDHLSSMLRQGLLYRMYRYLNSPRADTEFQKFIAEVQKAQGFDDNEQSEIYVIPENNLMGSPYMWEW